jgi:hypothetical protein
MEICGVCSRRFDSGAALRQHNKSTGHSVCQHCHKVLSPKGLKQHSVATHNWKCPQCPTTLSAKKNLAEHQRKSGHCYCGDCNKSLSSSLALSSHLQSSLHSTEFRCCDCDQSFARSQSLYQHLKDKIHHLPNARNECCVCHRRFRDAAALRNHMRTKIHRITPRITCNKCSRGFQDASALQQHLESSFHHPLGNLRCVAGSCKKGFSTPSGLIHHLESGACSSGMNRKTLNQLVLFHDTDRLITQSQGGVDNVLLEVNRRLAAFPQCRDTTSEMTTPRPSSGSVSSLLTPNNWTPESGSTSSDGWALLVSQASKKRCPCCSPKRSPFPTEIALQHHLQSAAHCEPFIVCPTPLAVKRSNKQQDLVRSFTTVSGLVQHLESGRCMGGIATFWKAINYLEKRLETCGLSMGLAVAEPGGRYTNL